jgi:2-C-methyl-D-erythritol 2,4-cyclodiphosphate synthase
MRIGHGYDVHRFGGDKTLILGGVHIPHAQGVIAHSDGDVVLHALTDALLGAAALGDIGQHFPDTDQEWRGKDSRFFVRAVVQLVQQHHWQVGNIDITIITEQPKLAPYITAMRQAVAEDLRKPITDINIKATTTEKLGYIGRGEGIAVHAVVLLQPLIGS